MNEFDESYKRDQIDKGCKNNCNTAVYVLRTERPKGIGTTKLQGKLIVKRSIREHLITKKAPRYTFKENGNTKLPGKLM